LTRNEPARDGNRSSRLTLLIGSAVATACLGVGVASAQEPTPAEPEAPTEALGEEALGEEAPADGATAETAAPEEEPAPAEAATDETAAGSGGDQSKQRQRARLRLLKEEASPGRIYWAGRRNAKFEYKFAGARTADLTIELFRMSKGSDSLIRRWKERNVEQQKRHEVRWNGDRKDGKPLKSGRVYFVVRESGGKRLNRKRANGDRDVKVYPAIFPVRGKHQYWDGFGAGRGHEGQDIGAKCGTPLVAAEPGKVVYKGYDGGGYGYYIIVNVRNANRAEVYSHLKSKARVRQGSRLKTGERIGKVGATGNASGCHLHFEYHKGDWPGGRPTSAATKRLRTWDKYS
jgi:murein DD-endopeptidase MepM/ murein hydrolase activator NlpD